MASSISETLHLVSCDSAAGGVMHAGARRLFVRNLSEHLAIGPCDVDPKKHAELRRAWNAGHGYESMQTFALDELRTSVAGDRPVVVWATRAYAEIVWLWWVLDSLARVGPLAHQLARPDTDTPLTTVGGVTPETALKAAFSGAHVISEDEFREGAELWKLFTSPDPRVFDEARRNGSTVFPELRDSADLYGDWFPRLEDGRLRLSMNDERILASLTDELLITWDLNKRISNESAWEQRLWAHGGLVAFWRLRQWAEHGVVAREMRVHERGEEALDCERTFFRFTDKSRALLENGLESVGDAPPLYVGGCHLNDPAAPWVRVSDGSDWRIIVHT